MFVTIAIALAAVAAYLLSSKSKDEFPTADFDTPSLGETPIRTAADVAKEQLAIEQATAASNLASAAADLERQRQFHVDDLRAKGCAVTTISGATVGEIFANYKILLATCGEEQALAAQVKVDQTTTAQAVSDLERIRQFYMDRLAIDGCPVATIAGSTTEEIYANFRTLARACAEARNAEIAPVTPTIEPMPVVTAPDGSKLELFRDTMIAELRNQGCKVDWLSGSSFAEINASFSAAWKECFRTPAATTNPSEDSDIDRITGQPYTGILPTLQPVYYYDE